DDSERPPCGDRVGDSIDRMDDAVVGHELDAEVVNRQEGIGSTHAYRTRGSMNAYRMSTIRFAITMKNAPISTVPWITGRSELRIESNERRPMPGMLNTVSVRITPPSSTPMSRP